LIQPSVLFASYPKNVFDIILGNPPFQDKVNESDTKNPRKGGKNKLYERITNKCFPVLNDDGFLLFVTPDNIFSGSTSIVYNEFLKYNTLFISINNIRKTFFPKIGISMCYFLIQKRIKDSKLKTSILNQDNNIIEVILKNRPINPISEWTEKTETIVNQYLSEIQNNAHYFRGNSEKDYTGGKYKVIYTPDKILRTNDIKMAPGIDIKKIVLFETKPMEDGILDNGTHGVGPHTIYVPVNTEKDGRLLNTFFSSDIYKTLVKVSLTSQYLKTSLISHIDINKILNTPNNPFYIRGKLSVGGSTRKFKPASNSNKSQKRKYGFM
jgi:hypothetical protein